MCRSMPTWSAAASTIASESGGRQRLQTTKAPVLSRGSIYSEVNRCRTIRRRCGPETNNASRLDSRRGKSRHPRGEIVEPGDEARIVTPPGSAEAKIAAPERHRQKHTAAHTVEA